MSRTSQIHLSSKQAMYAWIPEIGGEFFEGVCALAAPALESSDPPPPRNINEPEPWQRGSGPKKIMRRPTVDGALA